MTKLNDSNSVAWSCICLVNSLAELISPVSFSIRFVSARFWNFGPKFECSIRHFDAKAAKSNNLPWKSIALGNNYVIY